jgi:hypothetical protein
MNYDKDKVDDFTLALIFLGVHDEDESGARSWKGFDWDALSRLHQKGFIGNPIGKTKSVTLSKEGLDRAKQLFEKFFGTESA